MTLVLYKIEGKARIIARVVTIVVLIILAGITLNAVIGEDRNYIPGKGYQEYDKQ